MNKSELARCIAEIEADSRTLPDDDRVREFRGNLATVRAGLAHPDLFDDADVPEILEALVESVLRTTTTASGRLA